MNLRGQPQFESTELIFALVKALPNKVICHNHSGSIRVITGMDWVFCVTRRFLMSPGLK